MPVAVAVVVGVCALLVNVRLALAAPVAHFFQAFAGGQFEQADFVAGMFKLMDVSPDLGTPVFVVNRHLTASSAAGVQPWLGWQRLTALQFDENATNIFNVAPVVDNVLIAEKVSETQPLRLRLGFAA